MHSFTTFLGACLISLAHGHGRLLEPPNRSSIWRFPEFQHLNPPKNYNDNELNCGSFWTQHHQNGGKCGECGDPYQLPRPRPNEAGGRFGRGIIVRKYQRGQDIDAHVHLSANHRGYFEFRLCPQNDVHTPVNQSCLDQNLLQIVSSENGELATRLEVNPTGINFHLKLRLPVHLTCEHCVLQWHYAAGNNWGTCPDGTGALGCGAQETFRGCSDISIE